MQHISEYTSFMYMYMHVYLGSTFLVHVETPCLCCFGLKVSYIYKYFNVANCKCTCTCTCISIPFTSTKQQKSTKIYNVHILRAERTQRHTTCLQYTKETEEGWAGLSPPRSYNNKTKTCTIAIHVHSDIHVHTLFVIIYMLCQQVCTRS